MHYLLPLSILSTAAILGLAADEAKWTELDKLDRFKNPSADWQIVGDVGLDPENPRRFVGKPAAGVLWNGPKLRTNNLVTSQDDFTDVEIHVEFNVPKGSNSGVKFMGLYEIQILDSFGKKEADRQRLRRHLPAGRGEAEVPPHRQGRAAQGQRRQAAGRMADARRRLPCPALRRRRQEDQQRQAREGDLNGQVIHENVEMQYPTGAAWRPAKELPPARCSCRPITGRWRFATSRSGPSASKEI